MTVNLTKTIKDFDDALDYVNKLGYAGGGTIAHKQAMLCNATDLLLQASGQKTWHNAKSFNVKHHRIDKHGYNCFLVEDITTGKIMVAYPRMKQYQRQNIVEYIPVKMCGGWNRPVNDPYHACYVCEHSK